MASVMLLITKEKFKMEYNNLLDKLADLSDTSRADDFYKQHSNRNGKDLDSL